MYVIFKVGLTVTIKQKKFSFFFFRLIEYVRWKYYELEIQETQTFIFILIYNYICIS